MNRFVEEFAKPFIRGFTSVLVQWTRPSTWTSLIMSSFANFIICAILFSFSYTFLSIIWSANIICSILTFIEDNYYKDKTIFSIISLAISLICIISIIIHLSL
jgi:hypothetical protein